MSMTQEQQKQSSCCQACSPQALELRENADYNTLASIYNTKAEIELSSCGISLGAITSLPMLDNPTLLTLHQAFPGKAVLWVVGHISLLNAASGASNRMDEPALNLCALDIITSFPHVTMGEFCVFCARMRSLRYVSKRSEYVFSSDTIMQGMREFMVDRKYEEEKYKREHQQEEDTSGCMSHEEALNSEGYKAFMEREKERMKNAVPMYRPRESTIANIKTFAQNFKTQPAMLSEEEFAKRKQKQLAEMKRKYES